MRKRSLSVLVVPMAFVACGGSAPAPEPPAQANLMTNPAPGAPAAPVVSPAAMPGTASAPKPSLLDLEKQSADKMLAAFNGHDAKALAALYEENGVIASPSPTGWDQMNGRGEIEQRHVALFAAFPDLSLALERVFVNGNTS